MKNRLFLTLTLLTIVLFSFIPRSFAQEEAPQEIVDLNIGESNVVRLIYFLPNDREAQPDIDTTFDVSIKRSQKFFADEMARHGFGRKTFKFETDQNDNAIVHHIGGKHKDAFYQTDSFDRIFDELDGQFDFANNIYVIAVEISSGAFNETVCGIGGDNKNGGHVLVPASGGCSDNIALIPHELGHAFGLQHYFFNSADIMSYGATLEDLSSKELSLCNAQWLSVHPYFNSDKVITRNLNTSIHPLSAEYDEKPPHAFRLRFELNDPDGLHQAQLIASKSAALNDSSEPEFIDCQVLSGVSDQAEFATTRILDYVMIQVIDKEGNYTRRFFEVDSTVPTSETNAAIIPDPNLASAIREALTIQPAQEITTFDMVSLSSLTAINRGITDLTGLELASRLEFLDLSDNEIQDITPISALPLLRRLILNGNAIEDLTPISKLTHLTELRIGGNQIRDLTPLSNLRQLEVLVLSGNRISDITPLSNLRQLIALVIDNPFYFDFIEEDFKPVPGLNEISDITPLSNLTQLQHLRLTGNRVFEDLTPLTNLTQLQTLGLGFNQIRDVTPLKDLINLESLVLQHNQISDIRPLKGLVRLKRLYIDSNNQVEDISALENMTQLRFLQLPSPLITDITPLSGLTQLVELSIRNNQLRDISPLANLTGLRALALFDNQITDIKPLANMTELYELGLTNNQVTDLTPLSRLTKLERLALVNNQISDVRPLMGLVSLKELGIWGNPIMDRGPLLTLLRRNPGIRILHMKGGKPLPVTLSSFKAERAADGVVINWTTESELNNAGFNILRSRTQNGEFRKVNTKLIKGSGTTGERSTYTWTDTSAKPNTVYYYQIEDVSYAGVHKTLMITRLRGLISAKGKMITRWAHHKKIR
ncbi:MAG: leucine-rich repeat domain-containing protein [Candidatus Poribacteria bacterium]|nr:leucine-rich repeat domain-containing protein [Candidatus Poribacteria bacterium]